MATTIPSHPVGTGPFRLADWRRSSKIVLERNPTYANVVYDAEPAADDAEGQALLARFKGRKLPMIDRVEVSIIEESQPRWLSFLNKQQDLLERLPFDFMNVAAPNGVLAPHLARQERAAVADFEPRRALHLLQHAASGGRRLRTGQGRLAAGHRPGHQCRSGDSSLLARAGGSGAVRPDALYDGIRPGLRQRNGALRPAAGQGIARHVRLRRSRRRRLARAARRLAARAGVGTPRRTSARASATNCAART